MPNLWGELDDRAATDPRLSLVLEQLIEERLDANRVANLWMADNADFIKRHHEATNQPDSDIRRSIANWFAHRSPIQASSASESAAARVQSIDTSGKPKAKKTAHTYTYTYTTGSTPPVGRGAPRLARPEELRDVLGFTDTPFGRSAEGLIVEAHMQMRSEQSLARRWSVAYYTLGVSVVVLTAAAGTGALLAVVDQTVAALVTLTAAVLAALNTWLNPDAQRTKHRQLEAGWSTQASYTQRVWETRPTTTKGTGPEGWAEVVASLERDATVLRRGVVPDPLIPRWPNSANAD